MTQAVSVKPPFAEPSTDAPPSGRAALGNRTTDIFGNRDRIKILIGYVREENCSRVDKLFRERCGDVMQEEARAFPFTSDARNQNAEQVLRGQPLLKERRKVKDESDDEVEPFEKPLVSVPPESRPLDPSSYKDLLDYATQSFPEINKKLIILKRDRRAKELLDLRPDVMDALIPDDPHQQALMAEWTQAQRIPSFFFIRVAQRHKIEVTEEEVADPNERAPLLQLCLLFHDLLRELDGYSKNSERLQKNEDCSAKLQNMIHEFRVRHSLSQRFAKVFKNEKHEPKKMPGLFQALQKSQRDAAAASPASLVKFRALTSGSFTYAHFMQLEECAMEGEAQGFQNLHTLVESIRAGFDFLAMPAAFRQTNFKTREEILKFLSDHEDLLQQVEQIVLHDIDFKDPAVVPILCKLSGLKDLRISASSEELALADFPAELTSLVNIHSLHLKGHAFSKMPEALTKFPNLLIFSLNDNRKIIDEMPEAFTRHYLGGWASLAFEPVRELAPYIHCFCGLVGGEEGPENDFLERVQNYHTAALPSEQFNRIPFQLWFREHFSIPYITFHLLGAATIAIAGICTGIAQLHRLLCPGNQDGRDLNYVAAGLVFVAAFVPLVVTATILSLPIFVLNVIINRVIEPAVSWVRESCCECDPMVEL